MVGAHGRSLGLRPSAMLEQRSGSVPRVRRLLVPSQRMDRASDSLTTFWIGRHPHWKKLPYVLRLPVAGEGRLFLAAADNWPRGKDVFCRRLEAWPDAADVIEEV